MEEDALDQICARVIMGGKETCVKDVILIILYMHVHGYKRYTFHTLLQRFAIHYVSMAPAQHPTSVPVIVGGKVYFVMKVRKSSTILRHEKPVTSCIATAVCDPPCLNGGQCDGPNQCTCTAEYTGSQCEEGKLCCIKKKRQCASAQSFSSCLLSSRRMSEWRCVCSAKSVCMPGILGWTKM